MLCEYWFFLALLLSVLDTQTNIIIELTDRLQRSERCHSSCMLTSYCDVSQPMVLASALFYNSTASLVLAYSEPSYIVSVSALRLPGAWIQFIV